MQLVHAQDAFVLKCSCRGGKPANFPFKLSILDRVRITKDAKRVEQETTLTLTRLTCFCDTARFIF
jgi:hypothetical protein